MKDLNIKKKIDETYIKSYKVFEEAGLKPTKKFSTEPCY
jgi:hypothetical protein